MKGSGFYGKGNPLKAVNDKDEKKIKLKTKLPTFQSRYGAGTKLPTGREGKGTLKDGDDHTRLSGKVVPAAQMNRIDMTRKRRMDKIYGRGKWDGSPD